MSIPFFFRDGKCCSDRNKFELGGVQQPHLPTVSDHRTKQQNEWRATLTPYGRWITTEPKQQLRFLSEPTGDFLKARVPWTTKHAIKDD